MSRHLKARMAMRTAPWLLAFGAALPAFAQAPSPQPPHDMASMPGIDHGQMHGATRADKPADKLADEHASMPGMDHGSGTAQPAMDMDMDAMMQSMQGGPAPADARDPHAYADGLENGHMPGMDMADDAKHVHVMVDHLEQFYSSDGNGQAIDAQGWIGGDIDKLWMKLDGHRNNGGGSETRAELLWNRAIAPYWGLQLGVRQDFGSDPGQSWASVGVEGLAPYWFDIQATAYVSQYGQTALRFELEYELLLTQRLVLQPDVKLNLYGKDDPERGVGAGLSATEIGLRLRYEITRKFAPYVGVVWNRAFANTAQYARDAGDPVQQTTLVAGIRIWF